METSLLALSIPLLHSRRATVSHVSLDRSAVLAEAAKVLPTSNAGSPRTAINNPTDALAAVIHSVHSILGFRLVKIDSENVQASDDDTGHLPDHWNTSRGSIKFQYKHDQSSLEFVVSVVELGDRLMVAATAVQASSVDRVIPIKLMPRAIHKNNRSHSFDLVTSDYFSNSAFPLQASGNIYPDALATLFASPSRLQDLIVLYRINVLQPMVPGLRKEGYTELAQTGRVSSNAGQEANAGRPVGNPQGPYYPDSGGPLLGSPTSDPGRRGPSAGQPFPLGGNGGGEGPGDPRRDGVGRGHLFDVGRSDLLPLGGMGGTFGPPGSLGGGSGSGGGMYVGRDHPLFRDRFSDGNGAVGGGAGGGNRLWGGDGYLPADAVPPGARFDPIVPGNAPPSGQIMGGNLGGNRGQGQRGPQGPGHSGEPDWDGDRMPGSSGNDYDAMFG
ncbi:hypothetical protein OIV83_004245 [Microbotryomycetes sp. JL201]|nr:hypothetical protein OIV83_004245 [Microbotryomycetes sp. JL201]